MPLGARSFKVTPAIPTFRNLSLHSRRNTVVPRLASACLLALALLALPASAQEAEEWVEYSRKYAEVKAYRVLAREPDGVREVLARIACLPGMNETGGCLTVLEVYRKLSVLVMGSRLAFHQKPPPEGGEPGAIAGRATRYAIDCGKKRYAPLSIEWSDARGNPVTRIDYPGRDWRELDKIADLAGRVCR